MVKGSEIDAVEGSLGALHWNRSRLQRVCERYSF